MASKIQWLWPPGYRGETWSPSDPLERPWRWRNPRCIFVNSVSDLFHKEVPFSFVDKVFEIMWLSPQHQYIILTKQPAKMAEYLTDSDRWRTVLCGMTESRSDKMDDLYESYDYLWPWPIPNVWIGTSIENQYWMKQRGDIMKEIDWPNKLASFEPLLGPIDPTGYEKVFQWFVIGGESGPGARPMHPLWSTQLWHQLTPHAPGFWKQWGQWRPSTISEDFKSPTSNMRRVRYDPKVSKDSVDDRWMVRERSTQVYGGEWTEGRDIHRWPESMKLEKVKV